MGDTWICTLYDPAYRLRRVNGLRLRYTGSSSGSKVDSGYTAEYARTLYFICDIQLFWTCLSLGMVYWTYARTPTCTQGNTHTHSHTHTYTGMHTPHAHKRTLSLTRSRARAHTHTIRPHPAHPLTSHTYSCRHAQFRCHRETNKHTRPASVLS